MVAVAAPQSGIHRAAINFEDELALPHVEEAPRTYRSMEMPAVRAPARAPVSEVRPIEAAGRMLDATFLEDEVPLALDLKAPPSSHVRAVQTIAGDAPLPAMWAKSGSGLQMFEARSVDPLPGIVAFAGYGSPPEKLSATPAYAFRVITRKLTLRNDLKIAHWRRLPKRDIELYESALACADEGAVTKGLTLTAIGLAALVSAAVAAIELLF